MWHQGCWAWWCVCQWLQWSLCPALSFPVVHIGPGVQDFVSDVPHCFSCCLCADCGSCHLLGTVWVSPWCSRVGLCRSHPQCACMVLAAVRQLHTWASLCWSAGVPVCLGVWHAVWFFEQHNHWVKCLDLCSDGAIIGRLGGEVRAQVGSINVTPNSCDVCLAYGPKVEDVGRAGCAALLCFS